MKHWLASVCATGLLVATTAHGETPGQETYLFVKSAERAEFDNNRVTLRGADHQVYYFADRPYRDAGTLSREAFLELWEDARDSFANDPPNVAITGEADGEPQVLIVELTDPRLDGDVLTFGYMTLEGAEIDRLDNPVLVIDMGERGIITG